MRSTTRLSTGISGLDEILQGGWIDTRAYAVAGGLGTGKTTIGMHFLAAGMPSGDRLLWVGLDESREQILADAAVVGLDLREVQFLDLTPQADAFVEMHTYDIFSPAEVERDPITAMISAKIEESRPQRIFIDGFSQLRHLVQDDFHFRRFVQSCFRFATGQGATLLVSCDSVESERDRIIQSAADGVIMLEAGLQFRRLAVVKFRGSGFRIGPHIFRTTGNGIVVLPAAA